MAAPELGYRGRIPAAPRRPRLGEPLPRPGRQAIPPGRGTGLEPAGRCAIAVPVPLGTRQGRGQECKTAGPEAGCGRRCLRGRSLGCTTFASWKTSTAAAVPTKPYGSCKTPISRHTRSGPWNSPSVGTKGSRRDAGPNRWNPSRPRSCGTRTSSPNSACRSWPTFWGRRGPCTFHRRSAWNWPKPTRSISLPRPPRA